MIDFDEVYLTSQQILERISEKEIYEYFLGDTIKDKLVRCCFHKDSTPSLSFYKTSSNLLRYKCFGCGASGGVFDFVSRLNGNINFGQTIGLIQKTFKLSKNYGINRQSGDILINENLKKDEIFQREEKTQIIPTFRNFTKIDYQYWNKYHIPLELLEKYNIRPCKRVYVRKKSGEYVLFAEHSNTNPIYCYQIGDSYKIYRPLNPTKSGKWMQNCTSFDIQGMGQLPEKGELLIITSSMKDVLVLTLLGYNAIAPHGEGVPIPDKVMDFLWACFDNIVLFYDNDKAGLNYSIKYSEELGVGNIYIPIEYNKKDISDLVEDRGLEEGDKLMKELL